MMQPQATPIITLTQDKALTTSLMVAEKFGKRHKNVLRDIRKILDACPDQNFNRLNFEPVNYRDAKGEIRLMYNIRKDGFLMLAMGFSGQKAFLWKIAFINAFNRMEQQLKNGVIQQRDALQAAQFAKHPQWQQTRDLWVYGFSIQEIARLQGKHPRNVQRMLQRIRAAGIDCQRPLLLAA